MNELTTTISGDDQELIAIEATARRFTVAGQIADAMCRASVLPDHLRTKRKDGKIIVLDAEEIRANCLLVVNQALRWGVDPFAILPSTFVIGGNLGYDGKLIAAIVNKRGGLSKKLSYEFSGSGDKMTVTVSGTLEGESEPRTIRVMVGEAKTENEIWKKDPEQKLVYTGATRWARRHCPQVLLGIMTDDAESTVETIDVAASEPEPRLEAPKETPAASEPIDMIDVITRYKQDIAETDNPDAIQAIGERINAELALPEPARKDLRAIALAKYKRLNDSTVQA